MSTPPAFFRAAFLRFMYLFRKQKLDRELSAELESHLHEDAGAVGRDFGGRQPRRNERLAVADSQPLDEFHRHHRLGRQLPAHRGDEKRGIVAEQAAELVHRPRLAREIDLPPNGARKLVDEADGVEDFGLGEVPLELRVLAQVTPDNAPFVVASVGGLPEIENNIMVPTIRSIVRNVVGAQGRHVLDLADNRAELEHAVEDAIRPEGLRAGIVIKEVKFGDPALPPELLVSRLRQQLADQLQVTYQQEQKAQTQRIETEKARATAEQQHQLVEAVIGVQVSEQNKNAAKLRGEGQKLELEEVAQGQRAQADVLGQDRVLTITLVQQLLKTIQEKPEVVALIGRLVPQTVVSTGGQGTGLDSAAAIIGALLNNGGGTLPALTGQSSKK